MKKREKTPRGEVGRGALGPGVSVKGCSVIVCRSEDQQTLSTL